MTVPRRYFLFLDHLCYSCLMFVMISRLFIAALSSPAGKGLTSWLLFVMFNCVFVTFPCGILGQLWYLIVSIPDLAAFLTFQYSKTCFKRPLKKNTKHWFPKEDKCTISLSWLININFSFHITSCLHVLSFCSI